MIAKENAASRLEVTMISPGTTFAPLRTAASEVDFQTEQ
jgi:hypothetical protein